MFFETMVVISVIIAGCLLMIGYSIKKYRKLINPIGLLLYPFVAGFVFLLQDAEYINKQVVFGLYWLGIGIVIFVVVFMEAQKKCFVLNYRRSLKEDYKYNVKTVKWLINICCILMIISVFMNLNAVMKVSGTFMRIFTHSTYVRRLYLRRSTSFVASIIGWFLTSNILMLACLFPNAIKMKVPNAKIKLIFVILLRTFESIITMSKQNIIVFLVIIVSAFANDFVSKKAEWRFIKKYLKWVALLVIAVLVIIAYQRNYLAKRYDSYTEAVLGTITKYTSMPIYSFCILASTKVEHTYGTQCFRPIVSIISSFLGIKKMSSIQDTVSGATANVYTIFGNMYNDFGVMGIVILSVVFGAFFGLLFRRKTKNRLDLITVNAILNMTLFMGFYDFMMMQTVYFITIVYAFVFCAIAEKHLYLQE